MKILNSGLKIFFWIILIISFDIKSDISVKELDLKEVFKSGRSLMSLDNGLHYLEEELDIQNVLFIGVHGGDSEGYEWIYPLITINDNHNLMSFFRYNDNLCPNRAFANLSNEINRLLDQNKNIEKVVLMGHSYGAMIIAMFSETWINEVPLTLHSVAGPLTGPISSDLRSGLFKNICNYSAPKFIGDNVTLYQWRTIKELDGAFNNLDYDPQIIEVDGSIVTRLPKTYNGRRLGHNWSISWVADQLKK